MLKCFMPHYRRADIPGGTFFFTVVTHARRSLLTEDPARTLLGDVLRRCRERFPFEIDAIVILPDHLHTLWTLPRNDADFSKRWGWIKKEFSKAFLAAGGQEIGISDPRLKEKRLGIWQPRFWEHTIQDEEDFDRHFDYIHFNPVKHGLVKCPSEWQWSSFHRWVKAGVLPADWGCGRSISRDTFAALQHDVGEPRD